MKQQVLVASETRAHADWLADALHPHFGVMAADQESVERILQLVDSASAAIVFVRFGLLDFSARARLVEQLLRRKPNLPVVALGESSESALVIAAMRSGARDFLSMEASRGEVQALMDRVLASPARVEQQARGTMISLVCARPDGATSTLGTHLALAVRELCAADREVLLLDLGAPVGDSLFFLDLKPSYSFVDAVRSFRRFDQTLVRAAFARHHSGLSILPLPDDASEFDEISASDALSLTGLLRSYFDVVVANLAGFLDLERLGPLIEQCETTLVHVDQCVASCRATRRLLDLVEQQRIALPSPRLIVDRHHRRISPPAGEVASVLGFETALTLPPSGLLMVEAMNRGETIFEVAPRSPYAQGVRSLARDLLGLGEVERPSWSPRISGWSERLQSLWNAKEELA